MQKKVQKAIEISDAKIRFVSLVDKAANKQQFLVAKADDGTAQLSTLSRIVKVDSETHYITGIVYEPMVEDSQGNFMTAEEIQKAAYWFAKNGDGNDLQHDFELAEGVSVVENYIAPCDMQVGDTLVAKGTWLMTVEVQNDEIWKAVQKGDITGFSMGGVGKYSKEDVPLDEVTKTTPADDAEERRSVWKRLGGWLFGDDAVEKGAMMDAYQESAKYSGFWNAFYTLEDLLYRYNWQTDRYELEADDATIRAALADFSTIIQTLLTSESITKALSGTAPLSKAGKKMSSANKEKLDTAYKALAELREALGGDDEDDSIEKEKIDLDKNELQAMIEESVQKAVGPLQAALEAQQAEAPAPAETPTDAPAEAAADDNAAPTAGELQKMIDKSVSKAVEPVLKALGARGLPSNLNGGQQSVEKAEQHYLHGVL